MYLNFRCEIRIQAINHENSMSFFITLKVDYEENEVRRHFESISPLKMRLVSLFR